jgi:hypothetical protein
MVVRVLEAEVDSGATGMDVLAVRDADRTTSDHGRGSLAEADEGVGVKVPETRLFALGVLT